MKCYYCFGKYFSNKPTTCQPIYPKDFPQIKLQINKLCLLSVLPYFFMTRQKTETFFKTAIIVLGCICFAGAISNLDIKVVDWRFSVIFIFTLTIGTRLSLVMPRSNLSISFSDATVFLSFLVFGGETAIILSAVEVVISCFWLRSRGMRFTKSTILFNFGMTAVSTTISYLILKISANILGISSFFDNTSHLITALGILSISQFVSTSALAAVFYSFRTEMSPWQAWKQNGLSSSMSQIAGASFAGIIFKLITSADWVATLVALAVVAIAYVNYRHIIGEINESIEQAEQAERDKAEAERKRAEEAEANFERLSILFDEQEKISLDLKQSKDALEKTAYFDALTQIPNRNYLIERLELLIELRIDIVHRYYVLFIDLTRFKNINDSLGHPVGDKVLALVAKRLKSILRQEDTIARLGGDEFAVILNDLSAAAEAETFARRIHKKLTQPFSVDGHNIYTDLHIGVSPLEADHEKPEDVLRDADIAMHHAKMQNLPVGVFNKTLRNHFLENIKLEADLRFAVKRHELILHYQPIISLDTGELKGFEALLRWQHSKYGFISPGQFIPIAEESGLIIPMTRWILRESCSQIAEWQKISSRYSNLKISVNISGKHLAVEDLPAQVKRAVNAADIDPATLTLEITESSAMENAKHTIEILEKARRLGVTLSIDDFGTGYSSLSYLHKLPFDSLKIDRSFVMQADQHSDNKKILQTIMSLARSLNLKTVAEGIETEEQLRLLQDLQCDFAQGYLFSKPLPKTEIEELLYKKAHWLPESHNVLEDDDLTQDITEDNAHIF